jgi:transposase-like protein
MYHTILPEEQHSAAKRFLQQVPSLIATSSLCRRLKPVALLIDIAPMTLIALPHSLIANKFHLSPRAAQRRDNVIRQWLAQYEPDLYQAILNLTQTMPVEVSRQAQAFKLWLTKLLGTSVMPCDYCGSLSTVRIGHRLNFRCRTCRRTFNPLKKYYLDKLSHCELWLPFVDLLLQGETFKTISQQLGINTDTVAKWQRYFLEIMELQGFLALANYYQIKRCQRYRQTWLDMHTDDSFLPASKSHFRSKSS